MASRGSSDLCHGCVRDVFAHEIDMAFPWAWNMSKIRDLTTHDLDTIDLDYRVDTLGTTAVNPGRRSLIWLASLHSICTCYHKESWSMPCA